MAKLRFEVKLNSPVMKMDIGCLGVDKRALECLRKGNMYTVGDIVRKIDTEDDLRKIEGCGKAVARNIMRSLVKLYVAEMTEDERGKFYGKMQVA